MAKNIKKINMPVLQGMASNTGNNVSIGSVFSSDMAQSRFFTVNIDTIDNVNGMKSLPVKNISYTISGIDTMNLPIGVFKDIPIPVGKRLPKISITFNDDNLEQVESQLREWYESMIPTGSGIISYLDDMIGVLTYESYRVNGELNFSYRANVMLVDDFVISRDYESNNLKTLEISLIVLKDEIRTNKSTT